LRAPQVTAAANDGFNDGWIMSFGHSAEDGTMALLHCCVSPDVISGDFFEPQASGVKGRLRLHN
jgi:hypothetical protein